jgi:hypothetical protein
MREIGAHPNMGARAMLNAFMDWLKGWIAPLTTKQNTPVNTGHFEND